MAYRRKRSDVCIRYHDNNDKNNGVGDGDIIDDIFPYINVGVG